MSLVTRTGSARQQDLSSWPYKMWEEDVLAATFQAPKKASVGGDDDDARL